MKLHEKVIFISGASMGIGKALAWEMLSAGAKVVLASRNQEKLNSVREEFVKKDSSTASRILTTSLDVQSEESCKQAVEKTVQHFGGLDILINNAGFGVYGPLETIPAKEMESLFNTNYFGAVRLSQAVFPHLRKRGESMIVMISSTASKHAVPIMNHYCATKAAMNMLAETMRMEWAIYGIRVLTVMPGMTSSEFGDNAKTYGGVRVPRAIMGMTAEKLARLTRRSVEAEQKELIPGLGNKITTWARPLPGIHCLVEKAMAKLFAPWDLLRKDENLS